MSTKFNLNRPIVPDEEINSHKDFGELVKKFKSQSIQKARSDISFLKNKKITYSAIITGVTVVCTITYFAVFKKNSPTKIASDKKNTTEQIISTTQKTKSNLAFVAPPISKLNVPYTTYNVKAQQGATLIHKTKSKIIIPKNAFVNKQGQDIVGDVKIEYREFHNQADIIASGIPMEYDSAGVMKTLESAGMFDIKGSQNNEPVFINPKKIITVELASNNKEDKFNQYELDTVAKNWVYIKRDVLKGIENTVQNKGTKQTEEIKESAKTIAIQKQIDAIPPKIEDEKTISTKRIAALPKATQPLKPLKAVEGRPKFELDVNYKEFPELEAFKNAVFEIGAENKNYDPKMADITWNSAIISEGPVKGKNYLVTLKMLNRTEKLIVYPTLTGVDFDKANASYDSKFNDYKKLVVKREADEKRIKEEFEAKLKAFLEEQKNLSEALVREQIKIRKQQQEEFQNQFESMNTETKVMRVFNVSRFGICNSDCPNSMPRGATVNPIFVFNSKFITPSKTYLVCYNKNIVYTIYNGPINYNPDDTYSMCIVSNGKIYTCNKENFSSTTQATKKEFAMQELRADVNDAVDFKKELGL